MSTEYVSKRRSPRRRIDRVMGVLHKGSYYISRTVEIGEGGLMVQTNEHNVKVDDQIVITFSVEGHELVSCRAEVRYQIDMPDDGGVAFGVQFKNLDLSYKRYIRRYVSQKTLEEANSDRERLKAKENTTYTYSKDREGKAKPTVA